MDKDFESRVIKEVKKAHGNDIAKEVEDFVQTKDPKEIDKEISKHGDGIGIGKEKHTLGFKLFRDLLLETDHLGCYEMMDLDLGLDGETYIPLKKSLWYYHHSLIQPVVAYQINRKTRIDNRKHLLIITTAGQGKSTIKNQVKRTFPKGKIFETSGISHPEQLVGTTRHVGRNKEVKKIPGLLSYDGLLYDEAQDLINEKNELYSKCQRVKRISMDSYGENTVSKKLVEDTPEDVLSYDPKTRIMDFAHPDKLESPFFDTGSFRRYDIFNLEHDQIVDLDLVTGFSFEDKDSMNEVYSSVLEDYYAKMRKTVEFTDETLKIVSHFHKCMLLYMLQHPNKNVLRYGLLTKYAMRASFCKNVLILAMSKNEKKPSLETTIHACKDTLLFIFESVRSINDLGDMGISSDVWGGLGEEDAESCEYLLRKNATSEETSEVTVKEFWSILSNLHGCRNTQARKHFYKLKRDGFVNSKQVGDHSSCVWLVFRPRDVILDVGKFNPLKFWERKFKGVTPKTPLLTPLKSVVTDDKTLEKIKGVGGVGVLGCVLSFFDVNKKRKKEKNEFKESKVGEVTVTPPTPLQNKDVTATVKDVIKGVKTPKTRVTPLTPKLKDKTDRKEQFHETKECTHIKPNHTEEDVLNFIKSNPLVNWESVYDKFGDGSLKFKNDLINKGLVKVMGGMLEVCDEL